MSRAGADWAESEINLVRELAAQGFSTQQIAQQLSGRTRNAVIGLTHRKGIILNPASKNAPPKLPRGLKARQKIAHKPKPDIETKKKLSKFLFGNGSEGPPQPPQKVVDEVVVGKPINFMNLKDRHCRAILGPVDGINTLYCGKAVRIGTSWCEEHHAKFYVKKEVKGVKKTQGNSQQA
jgi:hypothetical protein